MKQDKIIFYYLILAIPLGIGSVLLHSIGVFVYRDIIIQALNTIYSSLDKLYMLGTVFVIIHIYQKKLPKLYLVAPITHLIMAFVVGIVIALILLIPIIQEGKKELIYGVVWSPLFFAYNTALYIVQIIVNSFLLFRFKYLKF